MSPSPVLQNDGDIAAAMRSLSAIGATLSASYAALERRAAHVEQELERKVSELDAVTRHLEAVLDALPTGIVVRDREGAVLRANGAAQRALDTRLEELIGTRFHRRLDQLTAGADEDWTQQEVEGPGGTRRVLATRRISIPSGDQLEIIDDRTEVVELSERLHALDKLAAMGNMAGGIAHELRNPMHAARGFATLLERRLEPDSKEAHFARRIVEGLENAEAVLASMLTLAAPERLAPESIEVRPLFEEALQLALEGHLEEGRESPWRVELALEDITFQGDRIKLRQALRNLIDNALTVQPDGGAVRLEARREGAELLLCVSDAGPGIPPELRTRVLDPFFTTRAEGTGLGLALVGTIADLHGGRVHVHPRRSPLGGAEIALVLPLNSPPTL